MAARGARSWSLPPSGCPRPRRSPSASRAAAVGLHDFRYWFSKFLVDLGIYGSVSVIGYTYDIGASVYAFDLSGLFDGTMSLKRHVRCGPSFVCGPAGPDDVVAVAATVCVATPVAGPESPDLKKKIQSLIAEKKNMIFSRF